MLVYDLSRSARLGRRAADCRARRRSAAGVALCGVRKFIVWLLAITATAAAYADPPEGVSHRTARDEAMRAIPFQQIPANVRNSVWGTVNQPSIYRRMPPKAIECDPELYLFLLRYPEIVVNIWELMGITQVEVERIGPTSLKASDGAGTQCTAHLVYGGRDIHVFYAEGFYEGSLLKNRVHGKCVLLLRSVYSPEQGEKTVIANHLDVFLKVDNVGVDLLAKTLHPLVGKSADYNFTESAAFLGKISQAAEANGPGVQRLAANLENVDPAVRDRFSELAATVSHRAALRAVDPYDLEEKASEVVQRAMEEGVTPFGQPLDDPLTPLSATPEPPRQGISLRR